MLRLRVRLQILFLVCVLCSALYFPSRVNGGESTTTSTTGTKLIAVRPAVIPPPSTVEDPEVTRSNPDEHLRKVKQLGSGTYGVTFEVVDREGKSLALKESHGSSCNSKKFQEDAKNEFKIGHELEHPSIARAHAFYVWGDKCAILMDLAKGDSIFGVWRKALAGSELRKKLDKNNHLLVWEIVTKIAEGIDEMCKNGIVHGDLSQGNVLVDLDSKQVTIVDLGAAKKGPQNHLYRGLTETCTIQSPERRHRDVTYGRPYCSSDVFALCSIATYLLGNPIITFEGQVCLYDRYDRLFVVKSESAIIANFKRLFREQDLSLAETLLLKSMCHADASKRSIPADLVRLLSEYLIDEYRKNEAQDVGIVEKPKKKWCFSSLCSSQ